MAETSEILEKAADESRTVSDEPPKPETTETQPPSLKVGEVFEIPVLALQSTTLFPETVVPLAIGRPRSVKAVEAALATEEKLLGCVTVKADVTIAGSQDAKPSDLYEVGTLAMIKRMERIEDTMHIIVQGTERIKVVEWKHEDPYLRAKVQILPELQVLDTEEVEATKRNVQSMVQQALALLPGVPPEVRVAMMGSVEPVRLAYFLGSILNLGVEQEQKMPSAVLAGMNRRQMVRTLGLAAVIAVPLVTTIVAPTAVQAASQLPPGSPCTTGGECQSGICCTAVGVCPAPNPIGTCF